MRYQGMIVAIVSVFVCGSVLAADAPARAVAPFPNVGPYEVLRCDFHIHTVNSDGDLTAVKRVEEAWSKGYDAIAITDHGDFKSYEEALPRAKELGLVLIRGMETGIKDREHMVAVNLDAGYPPRDAHRWALAPGQQTVFYQKEWKRLADDSHAFIIYAHPHVGYGEPVLWGASEGLLRGIEVKNGVVGKGWNTVESHGTWFYPHALDFAIEHNLAVFANSDMHETRNDTNSPVTLVLARRHSPKAVMNALYDGRTVAWFDGMLWGKEELLSRMMDTMVKVEKTSEGLTMKNLSPVALTASIDGKTVELKPNDSAAIEASGAPLTVQWKNVWITSTKTLETRPRVK